MRKLGCLVVGAVIVFLMILFGLIVMVSSFDSTVDARLRQRYAPTSITCYSQDGKIIFQKSQVIVTENRGTFSIYRDAEDIITSAPSHVVTANCVTGLN